MSEKYAGLTLGVDVSQVNNAIKSLKQFKDANNQAKSSVEDFVDQEFVARQRAKELAQELSKQRAEFRNIQAAIDPTASKMEKLRQSAAKLDALWKKGVVPDKDFFELGAILETQSIKLERSKKALTEEGRAALEEAKNKEKAVAAGRQFIASLQAQAEAAGKTQSELAEMRAAQLGVSEQAAPFIAQMKQQEKQVEKLGISMGQYRQAMRMLPAQITDVTTSLAGGMPIWLVAIQQGGQIKDSFGGLVPMFKALATFITPLNVGLAAIGVTMGALVYSVYSANEEFVKIRDTIKETTGLSGEFADKVAMSIKELADASGRSAEDIAKAYISTKDSAHDAIAKLIEVGYSYDDAVKKVNEYKGATNFTELNNEIANHQLKVAELSKSWLDVAASKAKSFALGALAVTSGAAGTVQANKDAINQIRMLNNVKQLQSDINDAVKKGELERASAAAAVEKEFYATNRVANAQKELNELIKQQKTLAVSNNEEAKKQVGYLVEAKKKEIEDLKKLEAKKSEPKKKGGGVARSVEEQLDKELYVLQAQLKTLQEHRTVNDVISQQRKSLWSIEKQIEILQEAQSKRQLTAAEKKLLSEQQSVLELAKQKAELGDQIALQERSNKLYQNSLDFIRQTSAAINEVALKQEGLTDRQIQRQMELNRIRDEYKAKGGKESDPELLEMLAKQQELYQKQDELQADWLAGAKNAFAQFGEEAFNVYDNIQNISSTALNGLTDQLTEFLTTGKASFADFAKSIISMIVKMIAKMVIFNALSGLSGAFGGGGAGAKAGGGGGLAVASVASEGADIATTFAAPMLRERGESMSGVMRGVANRGASPARIRGGAGGGGTAFSFGDINVDVNNGNDPKGLETGVKMLVQDIMQREMGQGGAIYNYVMEKR